MVHIFLVFFILFLISAIQLIASIEIHEPIAIIILAISALMNFYFVTVHSKARKKLVEKK